MPKKCCIDWLNAWYESQCNEDWEHAYGINIDSMDNPGWWIKIDLTETDWGHCPLQKIRDEDPYSGKDWIRCHVVKGAVEKGEEQGPMYEAFCSPKYFSVAIEEFRKLIERLGTKPDIES